MPANESKLSFDRRNIIRGRLLITGGIVLLPIFIFFLVNQLNHAIVLANIPKQAIALETFPVISTESLSEPQKKILDILKQEYTAQPDGRKYTEGKLEPWCADFVSWTMKEAGVPLLNSDNGSWRIEDTPPLLEYYKSVDLFEPAGNGYSPKVGDVAIYKKPSPFGNHTNIVIRNEAGTITSVGGNESNTIRVRLYTPAMDHFFLGYGRLPLNS